MELSFKGLVLLVFALSMTKTKLLETGQRAPKLFSWAERRAQELSTQRGLCVVWSKEVLSLSVSILTVHSDGNSHESGELSSFDLAKLSRSWYIQLRQHLLHFTDAHVTFLVLTLEVTQIKLSHVQCYHLQKLHILSINTVDFYSYRSFTNFCFPL